MFEHSWVVVSCGVRLSEEVDLAEIREPHVAVRFFLLQGNAQKDQRLAKMKIREERRSTCFSTTGRGYNNVLLVPH
jgi:hypothetical protein